MLKLAKYEKAVADNSIEGTTTSMITPLEWVNEIETLMTHHMESDKVNTK